MAGVVEVFAVDLHARDPDERDLELCLEPAERARAARLRDAELRRRHIVAHAALRQLLARAVNESPAEIRLDRARGKPRLPGGARRFNLTHAGELALVALCATNEVGVDLEHQSAGHAVEETGALPWTPHEEKQLASTSAADRPSALVRAWVRKEAVAKAAGLGLDAFSDFAIRSREGRLWIDGAVGDPPVRWVADLPIGRPWFAAVAASVPLRIELSAWDPRLARATSSQRRSRAEGRREHDVGEMLG
jgi:phosphopantetheinyl transferase